MLTGHMAEAKGKLSTVPVPDVKHDSFAIIMEAIYRDGLLPRGKITTDNAVEHVLLGSKFIVPAIQSHAEDIIAANLGIIWTPCMLELWSDP